MATTSTLAIAFVVTSLTAPAAGAQPFTPGAAGGSSSAVFSLRSAAPEADANDRADDLWREGRDAIEDGKYERALAQFTELANLKGNRTDGALYWKAYSLAKLDRRADALSTLADLQQRFKGSSWLRDARALEAELRQASGQTVSPDNQADDELKLMALRALMQSDPDRALPIIEQMLAGPNSAKVKERALFVVGQSNSSRARDVIGNIAKGNANPDLQMKAIRTLGVMGGTESRQILADVYRASSDPAVKRTIMSSLMVAGDKARLLSLAKTESTPSLRGDAVHQLGVMGAHAELAELYQTETSVEVKKSIIQAMFVGGNAEKLIDLARNEKDPELRRVAVRNLGLMGSARTGDAIKAIYQSDSSPEIKREAINALFLQNNGHVMVELARAEKDPALKKDLVARMSNMSRSKEVTDYLLELLR